MNIDLVKSILKAMHFVVKVLIQYLYVANVFLKRIAI